MKFIIEQSAYSGVLKIAGKVAHDMELVTGTLPEIRVVETIDHEEVRSGSATDGFSRMMACGRDCLSLSEAISGERYTDCFICRRFLGYPRL